MAKYMRRAAAIVIAMMMLLSLRGANGIVYWGQQGEMVSRVQQKLKQ